MEKKKWWPKETFISADGCERCKACGLTGPECTCNPDHPARIILTALIERGAFSR